PGLPLETERAGTVAAVPQAEAGWRAGSAACRAAGHPGDSGIESLRPLGCLARGLLALSKRGQAHGRGVRDRAASSVVAPWHADRPGLCLLGRFARVCEELEQLFSGV